MTKIVVIKDLKLTKEQKARLEKLGDLHIHKVPETHDGWLEYMKWADIVCSGKFGLKQKWQELKNVFISLPFVWVWFFDKEIMKKNNISVANSPGCNKTAVWERIIFMIILLFRRFHKAINKTSKTNKVQVTHWLYGKNITILGKWNIGKYVWDVCEKMGMNISYFVKWDNLKDKIKNADIVINCLSVNTSTESMLNNDFFANFKDWSYFVSVVDYITYDIDALIKYLDNGKIAGAALDAMWIQVWDTSDPFFQKIKKHPKIIATPHIAWSSDVASDIWTNMMIENIEAWLKWKPINLIN